MNSLVFSSIMTKEAGRFLNFIDKIRGRDKWPLPSNPSFRAQNLDNMGDDPSEKIIGGKIQDVAGTGSMDTYTGGAFDVANDVSAVSRHGKIVYDKDDFTGIRRRDWAMVSPLADQLDDGGRLAPIVHITQIPRKADSAGWAQQVSDDLGGFAERIGRTMSDDKRQRTQEVAQAVLDDYHRSQRNQTIGLAGAGAAGLAGAGLLARKVMQARKARAAQQAMRRNLAIGGGAVGVGAAGTYLANRNRNE